MDVIRCNSLTKQYGTTTAVDRLDLSVAEGEVFGFLGPNGSGKTTTLRILAGLIQPTSGRVWVNGHELPHPGGTVGVGAVFEEPAFYPWMTGRKNLSVLVLTGTRLPAGTSVDGVLERVGLSAVADRKLSAYSQGMRQRLGMAAALMRSPSLLLLDEPTNGMDPAAIRDFRSLLRSLAADGTTVFLCSHLLAEVEQVCDRVAVLAGGRLAGQGRVSDLATAVTTVRVLLDAADLLHARDALSAWPVRPDGPSALVVEQASGREVLAALAARGVSVDEVTTRRTSLEEVFLRLTRQDPDRPLDGDDMVTEAR